MCNGAVAVTWQRLPSKGGHFTNQPSGHGLEVFVVVAVCGRIALVFGFRWFVLVMGLVFGCSGGNALWWCMLVLMVVVLWSRRRGLCS